ncbi:hypothetical protein CAOG_008552 [Capsaspora owczarzaki ATCC 30864]|uniref:Nudix hydrolase domain-containing protein n=1 Tax=Capsaspora owczarzaki (strain ATCC 30864) TaxID=595528 RepID=A0A0D2WK44_CAPO3|nr:hypothetical protein CAOG_008552 [Capsaspora owczarzaki ATCC 30864]
MDASAIPLTSRLGRDMQVYHDGVRQVAGCVITRRDTGGQREILLVTSRAKQEWILPKGGWESDESIEESARREAIEEAGIVGRITRSLGSVQVASKNGNSTSCIHWFELAVDQVLDQWPEQRERSRKWVGLHHQARR